MKRGRQCKENLQLKLLDHPKKILGGRLDVLHETIKLLPFKSFTDALDVALHVGHKLLLVIRWLLLQKVMHA
jgi:hypothetical protein